MSPHLMSSSPLILTLATPSCPYTPTSPFSHSTLTTPSSPPHHNPPLPLPTLRHHLSTFAQLSLIYLTRSSGFSRICQFQDGFPSLRVQPLVSPTPASQPSYFRSPVGAVDLGRGISLVTQVHHQCPTPLCIGLTAGFPRVHGKSCAD